jgi:hypothetical protein
MRDLDIFDDRNNVHDVIHVFAFWGFPITLDGNEVPFDEPNHRETQT